MSFKDLILIYAVYPSTKEAGTSVMTLGRVD